MSLTTDEKHGWTFAYRYEQIRLDKYEEDAAMKTDDMMTKHEFILTILFPPLKINKFRRIPDGIH